MNKYCVIQDWKAPYDINLKLKKGDVVFDYPYCTYGVIEFGIAVTRKKNKTPFFEIDPSMLEIIKKNIKYKSKN